MRKIETKANFMEWCNTVNHGDYKHMCDYQDMFAHSDAHTLKTLFLAADSMDKELMLFCIQKAMGAHTVFDFCRAFAREQAEKIIEESEQSLAGEWTQLATEKRIFESGKEGLDRLVEILKKERTDFENKYTSACKMISDLNNEKYTLEIDIEKLVEENTRLKDFEQHIQELLNH